MNSNNSLHELGWILSDGSSLLINKINFALQITVVVILKRRIQPVQGTSSRPSFVLKEMQERVRYVCSAPNIINLIRSFKLTPNSRVFFLFGPVLQFIPQKNVFSVY